MSVLVMTLITKRHALFLGVNAVLIVLNFHIWGYDPRSKQVTRARVIVQDEITGFATDYDNPKVAGIDLFGGGLLDDDLAPKRVVPDGKTDVTRRSGMVFSNEKIAKLWRILEHNYTLIKPEVDAYSLPSAQTNVEASFGKFRRNYDVPSIETTNLVNCAKIIADDAQEHAKARQILLTQPKVPIYEETYQEWLKDCVNFRRMRGYVEIPLTVVEEEFPIAYSIAMFTDIESTERLLRAIYRPNNFYCIHVDTKASLLLHRTVQTLANCFDNVWIASHLDKIKWGDVSVLLPEINCMRDMVKFHRDKKWKYFINLTGQEFPLRTNYEIARIAMIFNGSNDIAGSFSRVEEARIKYHWQHRWSKTYQQTIFYNTFTPKDPLPFNLTFFKGELHGLFSRKMVEYIVESDVARKYLEWCWDTGHPSEHYWNTLNYNAHLQAPGGYIGPLDVADVYSDHPIIRAKNWLGLYGNRTCHGKVVRGICVYGVKDVPWLAQRRELFANKFHLTFQYLGYDCLEELHRNRTKLRDNINFNEKFYRNLPTVKYSKKDGL